MAFAMVVTIIGFVLLLDKLGIIDSQVWSLFWPLIIIFFGLSMMFNKMNNRHLLDDCCDWHRADGKKGKK